MSVRSKFSLIKLPPEIDTTLFLIKEELKTRKLFHILYKLGLNECPYQPHLDSLILQMIGLEDSTDETFRMYNNIMEKRSKKITDDYNSIMTQTMKAYMELMNEKKKLAKS